LGSGSGGYPEFANTLKDDVIVYGFLRMMSGDQESKRVKFVFISWVGSSVGAMSKSRVTVHKPSVAAFIGVMYSIVRLTSPGLSRGLFC
jgi:hypothetical protein